MKNIFILPSVVLSLGLLNSCTSEKPKTEEVQKIISVKTTTVNTGGFDPTLTYTGTAFPNREANLGSALPGRVEKIYFSEGEHVRKGQTVASLSGEMLLQVQAENEAIRKDMERVSRLAEKGSVTKQTLDHVTAEMKASDARVNQILKNASIVAPFSGTMVDVMVQEGENYFMSLDLKPGYSNTSGIVRLMQLDPIKIEIEINESDLAKVTKGMEAKLSFQSCPDSVFVGKVRSVKSILSTRTHTATCEIELDNNDRFIKPGMYADVVLSLPKENGILIPNSSIYRMPGTGDDFVFEVSSNNKVKRHAVQRKGLYGELAVVEGLPTGISIVTQGKDKVKIGDEVVVNN